MDPNLSPRTIGTPMWGGRQKLPTLLFDSLWLFLGVACIGAAEIYLRTVPTYRAIAFQIILFVPAMLQYLAGAHLIVRFGRMLDWLCSHTVREELAATLIDPRRFVLDRIRPRLVALLLPFGLLGAICVAWQLMYFLLLSSKRGSFRDDGVDPGIIVSWLISGVGGWVLAALLSLLAVSDIFARLCRTPGPSGRRYWMQGAWLSLITAYELVGGILFLVFGYSVGLNWVLSPALCWILLTRILIQAIRRRFRPDARGMCVVRPGMSPVPIEVMWVAAVLIPTAVILLTFSLGLFSGGILNSWLLIFLTAYYIRRRSRSGFECYLNVEPRHAPSSISPESNSRSQE